MSESQILIGYLSEYVKNIVCKDGKLLLFVECGLMTY